MKLLTRLQRPPCREPSEPNELPTFVPLSPISMHYEPPSPTSPTDPAPQSPRMVVTPGQIESRDGSMPTHHATSPTFTAPATASRSRQASAHAPTATHIRCASRQSRSSGTGFSVNATPSHAASASQEALLSSADSDTDTRREQAIQGFLHHLLPRRLRQSRSDSKRYDKNHSTSGANGVNASPMAAASSTRAGSVKQRAASCLQRLRRREADGSKPMRDAQLDASKGDSKLQDRAPQCPTPLSINSSLSLPAILNPVSHPNPRLSMQRPGQTQRATRTTSPIGLHRRQGSRSGSGSIPSRPEPPNIKSRPRPVPSPLHQTVVRAHEGTPGRKAAGSPIPQLVKTSSSQHSVARSARSTLASTASSLSHGSSVQPTRDHHRQPASVGKATAGRSPLGRVSGNEASARGNDRSVGPNATPKTEEPLRSKVAPTQEYRSRGPNGASRSTAAASKAPISYRPPQGLAGVTHTMMNTAKKATSANLQQPPAQMQHSTRKTSMASDHLTPASRVPARAIPPWPSLKQRESVRPDSCTRPVIDEEGNATLNARFVRGRGQPGHSLAEGLPPSPKPLEGHSPYAAPHSSAEAYLSAEKADDGRHSCVKAMAGSEQGVRSVKILDSGAQAGRLDTDDVSNPSPFVRRDE